MGQQQGVDTANGNAELEHADCRAAPGVDEDDLVAGFDQCARTKAPGTGNRGPSPEQSYAKC